DSRLAYGFVSQPGTHETTVTRPDVFRDYLHEQIALLLKSHGVAVEIGASDEPIPIHFAFKHDIDLETADLRQKASSADKPLRDLFDVPSLAAIDDSVVNCTWQSDRSEEHTSELQSRENLV